MATQRVRYAEFDTKTPSDGVPDLIVEYTYDDVTRAVQTVEVTNNGDRCAITLGLSTALGLTMFTRTVAVQSGTIVVPIPQPPNPGSIVLVPSPRTGRLGLPFVVEMQVG